MGFVGGAEVAFRMVGDDAKSFFFRVKAVLRFGGDDEDLPGYERGVAVRSNAVTVAADDDTNPVGGMGVLGLVGVGGNVQEVEAGISPADRRDEEGVGAAIDVAKATGFFDGAAEVKESAEGNSGHDNSRATGNFTQTGNGGIHSGGKREFMVLKPKGGLAMRHKEEVGSVIAKFECACCPPAE